MIKSACVQKKRGFPSRKMSLTCGFKCHRCGLGVHEPPFVAAVEMKSLRGETLGSCFHCSVVEYSEGASQSYGKFSGSAAMP